MTGVTLTTTVTNPTLLEELVARHRAPKALMQLVGQMATVTMTRRLAASYSMRDDAYRSGRLAASFIAGGADNHFAVTDLMVEAGSNLAYAAQVNEGGTIEPTTGKALAIPLPMGLKRRHVNWPRDLDPGRETLAFVPILRGTVIGMLIDPEGVHGFGKDAALFLLVRRVTQTGKHFAVWDEQAQEEVQDAYRDFVAEG